MAHYPAVSATVDGKKYLAVAVSGVTYLIWTVARDTGANLTKTAAGDVEIGGVKPPQVFDGSNTYIEWSSIPTIMPNPKNVGGVWQFTSTNPSTSGSGTSPILDLTAPNIKSYVYAKTNIGGWFFDAVLQTTHTSTLTITSHPVQAGSSISDYAYLQPRTLSMNIGMTDVAQSFIPGQFSGGSSRSVQAYTILKQLQQLRVPIQVYTRLGLYQNMLIETITVPDDYTTTHGLKVTVDMQELLVATVTTVQISSNPAVTDTSQKGKQQPQSVPPSLLSIISNLINGKSTS
ncbi:phage baseplate protein [Alicyclobacillus acidoterrestris]|uniref:phage baseplate protein n=1 Tax=Alicyclobacillus acidoterrestris TaxID=1450 RepID=UPI003F53359A